MNFKEEVSDTFKYIAIGLMLALVMNYGLGYVLGAEKPVMAVMSDSMEPTYERGDLVVIKGIEKEEIEQGDVVVYYNRFKHIPVVHRVVDMREYNGHTYFITQGDNQKTNPMPDQEVGLAPPLTIEDIRGEVVFSLPNLGLVKVYFSEMVAEMGIFKAIFVVLAALVAFGMVENLIKRRRGRGAEEE